MPDVLSKLHHDSKTGWGSAWILIPWWESLYWQLLNHLVNIFLCFSCFNMPSRYLKIAWILAFDLNAQWSFNKSHKSSLKIGSHFSLLYLIESSKCMCSPHPLWRWFGRETFGLCCVFCLFFFYFPPWYPSHPFRVVSFKGNNLFYICIFKGRTGYWVPEATHKSGANLHLSKMCMSALKCNNSQITVTKQVQVNHRRNFLTKLPILL